MRIPLSMRVPSSSMKEQSVASLAFRSWEQDSVSKSCFAIAGAAAPERRMIPTPPRPGGVAIAAMVSLVATIVYLKERQFREDSARSMLLVITHCCAIDSILFTTQYNTKPDGKNAKNTVKTMGNIDITFC